MQKALYPRTAYDLCYQKGDTEVLITVDTLQPAEYSVLCATYRGKHNPLVKELVPVFF